MRHLWLVLFLGSLVVACGGGADPQDPDASTGIDAAPDDAPPADAPDPDGAVPDGAAPDGAAPDGATPDGPIDAGGPDAPAWDPGPVGNVLAQTTVTIDGTTQTIALGVATIVIPAGALPNGTLLLLRLSNNVNRAGGTPIGGYVVQFLTDGVAPSAPLTLRLPSPGAGAYNEISSAELSGAWTDEGPATVAGGEVVIGVSHFSLWTATAMMAGGDWPEEDLHAGGPTYAGITSATTATTGGGIEILFPTLSGATYWIYVRPQTGAHTFQRAYAMTVAGNNPMFLGGLTPGVTYCVTVRARSAQVEDGNTAEQCAVAAATPAPAAMTMGTPPAVRWTDTELTLTASTGLAAGLRYDLERQRDGGGFTVVATRHQHVYRPFIDDTITFTDVVEVAGAYDYRVRAFADGVDVGTSNVQSFAIITKPWKQALARYPQTQVLRPSPRLTVDSGGRLVIQGVVSAGSATAFLAAPSVQSLRRGPDLTGDPTLWKRLWCRYQDVDFNETSIHHQAVARAADGAVFVLENSIVAGPPGARVARLFRIGATGCAQIVNTSLMGVFDLAVHPTDPMKLAVAANRGVFVSSDGGVTFRLFGGHQPRALAYAANGTLYLATSTVLASSVDQLTYTNYGTWPDATNPPQAMALRADGTMAVIGVNGGSGGMSGTYVGPAGGALGFEDSGLVDPHTPEGLTWLADGRLLVLMHISNPPGGPAERKRLAVRAAGGGWSTLDLPGPWLYPNPLLPVLLDPRAGHAADVYSGYLRSRDGGVSWERIPLGKAIASTVDGASLALFVSAPDGATWRSLDGGDTGVVLGTGLPSDGRTWFDPATPLRGYSAYNQYTSDGGATWQGATGAGNFAHVGFAGGGDVFATPVTNGPGSQSTNDGMTWSVVTGTNRVMACGNGTFAIITANGGIQTWSAGSFGAIVPISIPRTCAVSADGQTVYLGSAGGVQKSTTGIAGPYTLLAGSIGGTTPMRVSPDGQRLSFNSWWTDTGGQ